MICDECRCPWDWVGVASSAHSFGKTILPQPDLVPEIDIRFRMFPRKSFCLNVLWSQVAADGVAHVTNGD